MPASTLFLNIYHLLKGAVILKAVVQDVAFHQNLKYFLDY